MAKRTTETALLTIAAVRKSRAGDVEILFNERQRIFKVPSAVRAAAEPARLLKRAARERDPVRAVLDLRKGVLQRLDPPTARDLEEFRKRPPLLEKPEKLVRIRVDAIDPTLFNIADRYLKWPIFRRCRKIVPNYAKAKQIFDFCAKQSCHLGGPYDVSPCIPFQYVRDGCYARAHKMRRIITTRYRYCCEKVFSFAVDAPDKLAVKADKWGGCCVEWWYHVAPLIRVRVKGFCTLAMVIDPGMFNKPVLLSTWLAAQENTGCNPNARVSKYSIQPGSAYAPAFYLNTTSFSTDPNYTATDATLTNYHSLTTCP